MYNKLVNELAICGVNTVKAAAQYHPERINRLFLREERLPLFKDICKQLAQRKRPYKICDDEELLRICKDQHHQGVVAMIEESFIEPLTREDLSLWVDEAKTGVVLHSIGNDLNMGAIARAAAFFGAYFLVISEFDANTMAGVGSGEGQQAAPRLSTAAFRVAEGGMEHVVVRSVKKTEAFLRDASKKLFVIGTDPRARLRITDLPALMKDNPSGAALVLGNEEAGLPDEVKRRCSYLMRIPGTGCIDSLNVAQAAALFLHALYER
ncbi:MAG: RNA methyltransferase [Spirochaetaceae bacterium]|jgi:TrmH RNA methyltransferase|nr:RNA methyltransferase [Spirochaetaceae bacterium]